MKKKSFNCEDVCYVRPNVTYAITLNPCDKFQYWNYHKKRVETFYREHISILQHFFEKIKYWKLCQEVSPEGRLHFHGTISFRDKYEVSFFFTDIMYHLKKIYNVDIDTIDDLEHWIEYCLKQCDFHHFRMIDRHTSVNPYYRHQIRKSIKDYLSLSLKTDEEKV